VEGARAGNFGGGGRGFWRVDAYALGHGYEARLAVVAERVGRLLVEGGGGAHEVVVYARVDDHGAGNVDVGVVCIGWLSVVDLIFVCKWRSRGSR